MAISVQRRGTAHQLRVTHRLLPKPFFHTFDDEVEARTYGQQLRDLLDRGIVPAELAAATPRSADPLVVELVRAYCKDAPITDSDNVLLGQVLDEIAGLRIGSVTAGWADGYVRGLKVDRNLAPSSIRKRVGVLARVIDWHIRRTSAPGRVVPANPLRMLPNGYSAYTRNEVEELEAAGGAKRAKHDQERRRRLDAAEEAAIRIALAGQKRDDRERALVHDPEFEMLFSLILDTGMRLREAYRLRVDQVELARGIIHVEGSKGARGRIKPRTTPIKPALLERLRIYMRGRVGLMFPSLWDGRQQTLRAATNRLSARFAALFRYARVADFTEHDLRHEATCRWFELRRPGGGGWVFSDIEICRIMGWTDPKMALVYASLRGEDLAARMVGG